MSVLHTDRTTHERRAWLPRLLSAVALALVTACNGGGAPVDPRDPMDPVEPEGPDIDRDPRGPSDLPPARAPERLTAAQIHASLRVATGQSWADFEDAAATLGQPDYSQTTEEGRQMSVAFETLVGEAARETCAAAITADRALPATDEARAILRGVDLEAPDAALRRANLRRLILRFHGHEVVADDDPRVTPWLELLDAPIEPSDVGARATAADVEALRWQAVCVGLATHPDFLTY